MLSFHIILVLTFCMTMDAMPFSPDFNDSALEEIHSYDNTTVQKFVTRREQVWNIKTCKSRRHLVKFCFYYHFVFANPAALAGWLDVAIRREQSGKPQFPVTVLHTQVSEVCISDGTCMMVCNEPDEIGFAHGCPECNMFCVQLRPRRKTAMIGVDKYPYPLRFNSELQFITCDDPSSKERCLATETKVDICGAQMHVLQRSSTYDDCAFVSDTLQ